jgi:UDP-N-acetylglucosamine 2-epimerase
MVDALPEGAGRDREPDAGEHSVLVTWRRRESFGSPMESAFRAIRLLPERSPNHRFVVPVHPNPSVQSATAVLRATTKFELVHPVSYIVFVPLLQRARLVITESGGLQEKALVIGKPSLVLRESAERPEGIEAGTALLVGTDRERIVAGGEPHDEGVQARRRRMVGRTDRLLSGGRGGHPVRPRRAMEAALPVRSRRQGITRT